MELVVGLFLILYFFMAIDLLAEPLAEGFGYLLRFLFLCLLAVLKFTLLHALPWLLVHTFHAGVWLSLKSWQGAILGFAFASILIEEWRRGPQQDEEDSQQEDYRDQTEWREEQFREEDARDERHRDEDRQDQRNEEAREEETRQEEIKEEEPAADLYRDAVQLLRLPSGFTTVELSRAYKLAIRTAHPDLGGSVALCQQINAARDLIRQTHGWR